MPAGSLVGALVTGYMGDKLGRKKTVVLSGLFWVIGCILQSASVVRILFLVDFDLGYLP